MNQTKQNPKRIVFIEMMGTPGSYDASVYDHFEDKDKEGVWFVKRFSHLPDITISTCNVCAGDALPGAQDVDGLVLAGSYNSVYDNTDWQIRMREWIPRMRQQQIPILAICGSHQLIAHQQGAQVIKVENGPFAGTFPIQLTSAGKTSVLMQSISDNDCFQYANSEHVASVPQGSTLLASSSKVPVAALDYGNHCYSTQFHPEGSCETLSTVWRYSNPQFMDNYHSDEKGDQLVENFFKIVVNL